MDNKVKLSAKLVECKRALLEELEIVHEALARAKSSEGTKEWIEKLKKWHEELHMLVNNMPKL